MKIFNNSVELSVKIQKMSGNKHANLLASAIITLKGDDNTYINFSGFTIWKSKYEGFNVEMPAKSKFFKYCLCEKSLWERIKKEILKEYEKFSIPIIEETGLGQYATIVE